MFRFVGRFFLICFFFALFAKAEATDASDTRDYSAAYFYGWMTKNNIFPLLVAHDVVFEYGNTNSLELEKVFSPENPIRTFFKPIVNSVGVGDNFTIRNDPNGKIYEEDVFFVFRWQHFPWDKYLLNSFAIDEGLSYVTAIPYREEKDSSTDDAKRFLNFLGLEATAALPDYPNAQLALRIHHRCGAWGLFGAGNLSSNAVELGLRYWF